MALKWPMAKKTVPENGAGCDDAELWRPRQIEASKGDFDPSEAVATFVRANENPVRMGVFGKFGNWGLQYITIQIRRY